MIQNTDSQYESYGSSSSDSDMDDTSYNEYGYYTESDNQFNEDCYYQWQYYYYY